jgi:hypothetical protein
VKIIEGPSARLAEIVASTWGNCRAAARVIDETDNFVVSQGAFVDLERNVAITYESRRSIRGKYGRFSNDMIGVTANAACSIALRNAVFKGVPKAFWIHAYEAAVKTYRGDQKTLVERRDAMLGYFKKLGVSEVRVLTSIGKPNVDSIDLDDLVRLKGFATAIKDGDTTIEDTFPAPQPAGQPLDPNRSKSEQLAEALKTKDAEAKTDESQPSAANTQQADQAVHAGSTGDAEPSDAGGRRPEPTAANPHSADSGSTEAASPSQPSDPHQQEADDVAQLIDNVSRMTGLRECIAAKRRVNKFWRQENQEKAFAAISKQEEAIRSGKK